MFNKLFKYDFRFVLRIWWIFAVATVGIAVAAGLLIGNMASYESQMVENVLYETLTFFGTLFCVIGLSLFPLVYMITSLVRYYTNFFSDEGYLTFTLPVKRRSLLNSKLLTCFLFEVMTVAVIIFDIFVIAMIAAGPRNFFDALATLWQGLTRTLLPSLSTPAVVCLVLLPFFLLSVSLMNINVYFACLTFGAVIAKKHKVLAAIGIYLGVNTGMGFIQQILSAFTISPLLSGFYSYNDAIGMGWEIALFLAVSTIVYAGCGVGFYCINLHCLKNKLNLN